MLTQRRHACTNTAQLLPTFDRFLKDLDEVKVGVIQHLCAFLAVLGTVSAFVAGTTRRANVGEFMADLATKPEVWAQWKNGYPHILDKAPAEAKPE